MTSYTAIKLPLLGRKNFPSYLHALKDVCAQFGTPGKEILLNKRIPLERPTTPNFEDLFPKKDSEPTITLPIGPPFILPTNLSETLSVASENNEHEEGEEEEEVDSLSGEGEGTVATMTHSEHAEAVRIATAQAGLQVDEKRDEARRIQWFNAKLKLHLAKLGQHERQELLDAKHRGQLWQVLTSSTDADIKAMIDNVKGFEEMRANVDTFDYFTHQKHFASDITKLSVEALVAEQCGMKQGAKEPFNLFVKRFNDKGKEIELGGEKTPPAKMLYRLSQCLVRSRYESLLTEVYSKNESDPSYPDYAATCEKILIWEENLTTNKYKHVPVDTPVDPGQLKAFIAYQEKQNQKLQQPGGKGNNPKKTGAYKQQQHQQPSTETAPHCTNCMTLNPKHTARLCPYEAVTCEHCGALGHRVGDCKKAAYESSKKSTAPATVLKKNKYNTTDSTAPSPAGKKLKGYVAKVNGDNTETHTEAEAPIFMDEVLFQADHEGNAYTAPSYAALKATTKPASVRVTKKTSVPRKVRQDITAGDYLVSDYDPKDEWHRILSREVAFSMACPDVLINDFMTTWYGPNTAFNMAFDIPDIRKLPVQFNSVPVCFLAGFYAQCTLGVVTQKCPPLDDLWHCYMRPSTLHPDGTRRVPVPFPESDIADDELSINGIELESDAEDNIYDGDDSVATAPEPRLSMVMKPSGYMLSVTRSTQRAEDTVLIDSCASVHIERTVEHVEQFAKNNSDLALTVSGLDGVEMEVTHSGYCPSVGKFLVVPTADATLISVAELTRHGCSLQFDADRSLTITAPSGQTLTGRPNDQNHYAVSRSEYNALMQGNAFQAFASKSHSNSLRQTPGLSTYQAELTAEQRSRALKEWTSLHGMLQTATDCSDPVHPALPARL
eukprot:gene22707-28860_t